MRPHMHTWVYIHMHTYHIHGDTGKEKKKEEGILFLGQFKDPSPLVMSYVHYDGLTTTNVHMMYTTISPNPLES